MFVRSTGSSRTVNPGRNICTGGGSFTEHERLAAISPSGGSTSLMNGVLRVEVLADASSSSGESARS